MIKIRYYKNYLKRFQQICSLIHSLRALHSNLMWTEVSWRQRKYNNAYLYTANDGIFRDENW